MEKVTLKDLAENENWEEAVIVFTAGSFKDSFSEVERSYKITRDNKYFKQVSSSSLYGDCLDGTDKNVELTQYIFPKIWKIDYCYIFKK